MKKIILMAVVAISVISCSEDNKKTGKKGSGTGSGYHPNPQQPNKPESAIDYLLPLQKLGADSWPQFSDDHRLENMMIALDRQLQRFQTKNMNGHLIIGDEKIPLSRVRASLEAFKEIAQDYLDCEKNRARNICEDQLTQKVKSEFDVYIPKLEPGDPRYGEDKTTFFTAYYTPTIEVSTRQGGEFQHGIYRTPSSTTLKEKSRAEIDFDRALDGKNLDLAYAKDLFDLYLLHIQGGGKLVDVDTGDSQYISYDSTNGMSFRFISKYMLSKKYISNLSVETQRQYLQSHPETEREIYSYCPSYVFFKESSHPPEGSDLVPLTNFRSIATDYRIYKFKGLLGFIEAKQPRAVGNPTRVPFSRFVLDQDTGGAIRGKGRVDIYQGENAFAEYAAYNTQDTGNLYFLILKRISPRGHL